MSTSQLFSILIANYNNGKYLTDAIGSVYAQTYTNWEIILVDDASTDNSKELYKELEKDARIHIFYNEENKGCGYTKRRCAELANGEICGFLDPDDMLLPNAIEAHVTEHINRKNISCVFSRYYNCDENMTVFSELRLLQIGESLTYFTNRDYAPEHFVTFKKRDYDKTEGISADIKLGVDQDLYFKLEEVAPIFVLNMFTYKYRHANGISQGNANAAFYWNLIVRHRTCIRRNLNPNDYPIKDFEDFDGMYLSKYNKSVQTIDEILNSYSYRFGYFLLTPLRWIKMLLKKKQQ